MTDRAADRPALDQPGPDGDVDALPTHERELAAALNRLGNLLVARRLDPELAAAMAATIEELSRQVEPIPEVSKAERLHSRDRVTEFLETGDWPAPPPDGATIEFDASSLVGGAVNPFTIGARYHRDGDEAVGRVTIGRCFEGPPDRVHGGVLCAIFDEVMGSVFRATGTASGFTGELKVRFEAAAPLGVELEFRARQVGSKGRRQFVEAEGVGPDGQFASATATFVEMTREQLLARQPDRADR